MYLFCSITPGTPPPSKSNRKPPMSRKSLALQLLACGAILLVAWAIWRRGQPERLPERSYGSLVSHGMLYTTSYSDPRARIGPRILVCPVDGAWRILVDEDSRYMFGRSPALVTVADGAVYYGMRPYAKPAFGDDSSMGGVQLPHTSVFTIPAGVTPLNARAGETRREEPLQGTGPYPMLFRRAPLKGGSAEDLATVRGTSAVLIGTHVFWNRPGPETVVQVSRDREMWTEVAGSSALMLTDLATGQERPIGQSVHRYTDWTIGRDGVFWTALRLFPDRAKDLFYARAATGKVLNLGEMPPESAIGWSVEHNGSLYWFHTTKPSPGANVARQDTLMAAKLDGSGVRAVLALDSLGMHALAGRNLGAHRGALYCVLVKGEMSAPVNPTPVQIARIRAGSANPLETVRTVPSAVGCVGFDDGYFYYYTGELQRNLWDTLTDETTKARRAFAYFRVPLQ